MNPEQKFKRKQVLPPEPEAKKWHHNSAVTYKGLRLLKAETAFRD
jgi:hypothetical protein